ncbi:cysteine--tRNA ligase [Thermoflavifilum thermophilum]|uniref:Cysteine--tRNA ligase n=1 Tax=Thermoflavifilum thermophilum TaxID=1393122 RepID=A0A1I7N7Q7_9BACT|nr:cysteine--tRNA ligase [Thermoflavifilum thermophilum]SFV30596.1 cysteinyl-tRNA synthetase [Thermoflavifilum thermophilum]
MSELLIYNSLTRQKELFRPLHPPYVGLYVCGPTVSGESHLGHARPYITFDVVYRYLRHLGYQVRYVRNITDAGHFEEEGREAEDKIAKGATLEKLEPMELVQKYTRLFHWGMQQFNCLDPNIEPTATGHIIEQISMIEDILAKGYAYVVNGSVYFDVVKYAAHYPYGQLSGRVLDELLATTRELEGQEEKRNKADFALWKKAPPQHIMRWKSPWGEGFPGWHIECSAMSTKYLGHPFDIHGGGMDLLFPHHECEIAQSTIAYGEPPVRYWMHNNMITINGRKMGKSYNNVIKLTELFSGQHPLLEQPYHPMVVRFYILQTHYRSTLDFSNEALQAAERGLQRLWEAFDILQKMAATFPDGKHQKPAADTLAPDNLEGRIHKLCMDCREAMDDDFNTARVLADLFELVPIINAAGHHQLGEQLSPATIQLLQHTFSLYMSEILGLQPIRKQDSRLVEALLELLIDIRREARLRKDYATSDRIRQQLQRMGIQLKDEKDGSVTYSFQ